VAQILQGDCRDILPTLDAGSVHCVVTSPPYWGLRDYGTATWDGGDPECDHLGPDVKPRQDRPNPSGSGIGKGGPNFDAQALVSRVYRDSCGKCGARRIDAQLGLEPTPEEYVANMVAVFREVRRVLRDDGTVWLNLGDSYASSTKSDDRTPEERSRSSTLGPKRDGLGGGNAAHISVSFGTRRVDPGLKPKDLVGIPWRVAFALQADGWYLRSDIIWSKPNPMPESVTDRPTKAHEYVFLLSKRATYYFDQEAVREPDSGLPSGNGFNGRQGGSAVQFPMGGGGGSTAKFVPGSGRNIRSVWTIATQPYPEAHFATFPEALVVPCIKAGTSERGVCAECGAPWERVVELDLSRRVSDRRADFAVNQGRRDGFTGAPPTDQIASRTTTGWRPSCAHDAPTVPATVLDCFGGSGTVGAVAERLSRRAILIELSPEYVTLAESRNRQIGLAL
jgi:DNA modification methylase